MASSAGRSAFQVKAVELNGCVVAEIVTPLSSVNVTEVFDLSVNCPQRCQDVRPKASDLLVCALWFEPHCAHAPNESPLWRTLEHHVRAIRAREDGRAGGGGRAKRSHDDEHSPKRFCE